MVADMRKLSGFDLHVYCIRNDLRTRRPTDGVLAAQSTRRHKQTILKTKNACCSEQIVAKHVVHRHRLPLYIAGACTKMRSLRTLLDYPVVKVRVSA